MISLSSLYIPFWLNLYADYDRMKPEQQETLHSILVKSIQARFETVLAY